MTSTIVRLIVAGALFGAWAYMVATGRSDIASFIEFIKGTLVALAAHTVLKGDSKP